MPTPLAIDEGKLLGIEIGFDRFESRERIVTLNPAWVELLTSGIANQADIQEVVENSDHASWLSPAIAEGTYYVHALSVKPEALGIRVGTQLLFNALESARQQGLRKLHLNVVSYNSAVHVYRSMGLSLLVEVWAPIPQQYGAPLEWRIGINLE